MQHINIITRLHRYVYFVLVAGWFLVVSTDTGFAQGQNKTWIYSPGGRWTENVSYWSPPGIPAANSSVFITNSFSGSPYTVVLDTNYPAAQGLSLLMLGSSSGISKQTLAVPTNFMTVNGQFIINTNGILSLGISNQVTGTPAIFSVNNGISINSGTIRASSGQFITRVQILTPSSALQFPISPVINGTIIADSSLFLDGTVTPILTGFTPAVGQQYRVIRWPNLNSRHGGFSQTNSTFDIGGGLYFQGVADYAGLTFVTKTTNNPPLPPPTNLVNQVVSTGDTATFYIAPLGQEPFTYRWQFGSTTLTGETNSSLIITNAQLADAGGYGVTVTDASNVVNSYFATLTVLNPPVINRQPSSLLQFVIGNNASFNISLTGDGPFRYQWRLNGANIVDATNATLTVSNATIISGGAYSVSVANPVRRVTSSDAMLQLSISTASFGDDFARAGFITGSSVSGNANNTGATNEPGEPLHANKIGGHSVWTQWQAPSSGLATINTIGSSFDTLLGVYTGTSVSNLTMIASDDDSGGFFTSQTYFNAIAGTNYFIAVDGRAGQTGNIVLTLSMTNVTQTPIILQNPADITVAPGGTASFIVLATNTSGMTYQWYYNDWLKIPGGTNAALVITNVDYRNAGPYNVELTSTNGQVVASTHAVLEISSDSTAHSFDKLQDLFDSDAAAAALGHLAHRNATGSGFPSVSAGGFGSQTINNYNSTTDAGDPTSDSSVGGSSRWYELNATSNGTFVVDTIGSDFDTTLAIYTGSDVFSLTLVTSDNNGAPDGKRSKVKFSAVSGTRYLIDVDGVGGASGNANVNWKLGTAPTATNYTSKPLPIQGSNLVLQAGITNGIPAPAYQWRFNGTNIAGATNATLTLTNIQYAQSGIYTIIETNFIGAVTNTIATVNVQVPLQLLSFTAGKFILSGTFTQAVVLQLSTNLVFTNWTSVVTNTNANILLNYTDSSVSTRIQGYYRFKSWP